MFSMTLVMRCFVCLAFLSMCQAVDEKMTAAGRPFGDCVCSDKDGRTINLLPLQRTDGQPRYTAPALGYEFSYNPCRSFYKGPPQSSACRGDVAVCNSTVNGAVYQNIGRQSSARCGVDGETLPQLEYTNRPNIYPPQSIVKLKCDPTKKGENDGVFEVIDRNKGVFILSHNCACPNGCPLEEDDVPTSNPTPDSIGQKNLTMIAISITVVAVVSVIALALLIALIIFRYPRRGDNYQPLPNQGQQPADPPPNGDNGII